MIRYLVSTQNVEEVFDSIEEAVDYLSAELASDYPICWHLYKWDNESDETVTMCDCESVFKDWVANNLH